VTLMYGHSTVVSIEPEGTFGTLASGNWKNVPVDGIDFGVAQPWERLDVIGLAPTGRDEPAPLRGLLTVEPRVDVPLDVINIGHWLRLLFGAPSTSGTTNYTHVYKSGGSSLPSISLQAYNAALNNNAYFKLAGLRAGGFELPVRFGESKQSMTINLAGVSATRAGSSSAGTATTAAFTPFVGAVGKAQRGGSDIARVTGANLRFSNGLEMLREANRSSAAITEAAPGMTEITGTVDLRMDTDTLLADSEGTSAIELIFGYQIDSNTSLLFTVEAAYLDRLLPPVRGRAGIQATFSFRGAYESGATCSLTATLKNQTASYA
jgi:hypothetical protein